jgi:hypothetical protein
MVLGSPFTEIEVLKMDIAELTKQNYQSMIRIKELIEENNSLRNKQIPKEPEPEKSPLSTQTKGYPSEASVKAQMRGH